MENLKRRHKVFDNQKRCAILLASGWEGGLPARIRALIEINHSVDHLTLVEQINALIVALPLRQVDIDFLAAQIAKPYLAGTHIETHVRLQLENIAHLATAGQPLGPLDAVTKMFSAFQSTAADREDFARVRSEFLLFHGPHAQQTPQNFAMFIVEFVNNRLAEHRIVNTAARALRAHSAVVDTPPTHPPHHSELDVAYQAYLAIGKPVKPQQTKKVKVVAPAPVAVVAPRAPRQLAAGAPPFYCWTHACDFSLSYPHYSHECKVRDVGHKRMATLANQMGGKPA